MSKERFELRKVGMNKYLVYDNERGAAVLATMSPNAKYNKDMAAFAVKSMNHMAGPINSSTNYKTK